METKYIPLDAVLALCPENDDICGFKPSALREKILAMPSIWVSEDEGE